MRQSLAIAERATSKAWTVASIEASQGDFTVCSTQTVYSCWGLGADGRLIETWCKTLPNQECRATCPVWSDKAAA
jgi:hypothetical protein